MLTMESKVAKVLCAVAAFLGLLSAVLGFAAEVTKVKVTDIFPDVYNNVCLYSSSPASVLGFASAFILLVAFIIVNLASGCFCCYTRHDKHPPSTPRPACNPALLCFIFSWITFVVAIILMLVAAGMSTKASLDKPRLISEFGGYSIYTCFNYSLRPGVFAAPACLSLISIVLGITCSLNLGGGPWAGHAAQAQGGGGIALGQPQVPPPMQHAGFAYEDTYPRR